MRRWLLLTVVVVAVLIGLLVGMLNAEQVTVDVLFTTAQMSLGLLIMAAFVVGLLSGVLCLWTLRVLPLQFRLKRLQREVQQQSSPAASDLSSKQSPSENRLLR